jgi:hypothetical protein
MMHHRSLLKGSEGRKRAMSNTIELDFKADNFEEAISQAIVAALGSGMCPREIIAQLISRGFLRDPGNNALEDVVRGLADMADQLRRDPAMPTGQGKGETPGTFTPLTPHR